MVILKLRVGHAKRLNLAPQRGGTNIAVNGRGAADELYETFGSRHEKRRVEASHAADFLMVRPVLFLAFAEETASEIGTSEQSGRRTLNSSEREDTSRSASAHFGPWRVCKCSTHIWR
jgi:hypothetical protein